MLFSRVFAPAPCSSNTRTISGYPLHDGHCNGSSRLDPACASASCAGGNRTTFNCLYRDAPCTGVQSPWFRAFTSLPCSMRTRATSEWPCCDAQRSAVPLLLSRASASMPCSARVRTPPSGNVATRCSHRCPARPHLRRAQGGLDHSNHFQMALFRRAM
jgi:hypothetical protein